MRVKLCASCPYTPRDLAGHYDPNAALHACAKCDGERRVPTGHYPREAQRSGKCATVPQIFLRHVFRKAQPGAALSATESLV
jgi:hypothetical protein